jgi:hypothetical protein
MNSTMRFTHGMYSKAWATLRDQVYDEIAEAAAITAPDVALEVANDAIEPVMRRFAEYLDELG